MKRLFFIIVLLLGFMAVNAQVRKVTLQNVYVTNAAWAGINGAEALKRIELVTDGGATVFFDTQKKQSIVKVHRPEKSDVFVINEGRKQEDGNIMYSCIGTEKQGNVEIFEYTHEKCVMLGFCDAGVIFVLSDMEKGEILGLY